MKDTDLYSLKEMLNSNWWIILTDNINIKIKNLENKLILPSNDLTSIEQIKNIQYEIKGLKDVIETPDKLLKNRIKKQVL